MLNATALSYASSRTDNTFLSYFASTTPDSEHKRVRLKTALFLQGSTLYDPAPLIERLREHQKVLKFEIAIVDGKVGVSGCPFNVCCLMLKSTFI